MVMPSGPSAVARVGLVAATWIALSACKERVTQAQCDELLDRFAALVVKERMPAATPEAVRAEQVREREDSARADAFKNCTTELRVAEYRCAVAAQTSDALLQCLE
jgi:hypothetical protein